MTEGRLKGHSKLIWAASGVWNCLGNEILLFQRGWYFDGEMTDLERYRNLLVPGFKHPILWPFKLPDTEESKCRKSLMTLFQGVKFNPPRDAYSTDLTVT